MRIAETASHRPFQDHELSISRHVPEREYTEPTDRSAGEKVEMDQRRGNLDPITPIVGVTGGTGRTPIPVAESTRQPEKEIFTPGDVSRGEGPEYRGVPGDSRQRRGESAERDSGLPGKGRVRSGPYPNHQSPVDLQGKVPLEGRYHPIQLISRRGEFPRQEYLTPEQWG